MTFSICLFLVVMQFAWKYVEDMVGKGLGVSVIGEMFFYATLFSIPTALPLAILLAALMVFGNLGESLELLAIKSAGIPLLRIMQPLIILVFIISVGTFFFQDRAMPKIQTKFYSLLISIRQASPELDIPEGSFYKEISGYSLYVESKNKETGMLYDVMIYDVSGNFQDMAVIVCDSAKMEMSEDKMMVTFTMHHGQQFRNFNQGSEGFSNTTEYVPYARESFLTKTMMIPYDANFNRMDEERITGNEQASYVSKNIGELTITIDSLQREIDSVNLIDRRTMKSSSYLTYRNEFAKDKRDSIFQAVATLEVPSPDTLFERKELQQKAQILQSAYMKAENNANDFMFRAMNKTGKRRTVNLSWIEWHRRFTIPMACLVFFFIGAPLGSIVRKGGIGTPIVFSVIIFIIYYILDNVGRKMTRDGLWEHWGGMWFSTFILAPLGIFLTYKAMNDSVIMNSDTYTSFFKKIFFIRDKRRYTVKDVVIESPNYPLIKDSLARLSQMSADYLTEYGSLDYKTYWMDTQHHHDVKQIKTLLEQTLTDLSNTRRSGELTKAEEFPVLTGIVTPVEPGSKWAKIWMYVFPVGMIFKGLSWIFERRLRDDLKTIQKVSRELSDYIS